MPKAMKFREKSGGFFFGKKLIFFRKSHNRYNYIGTHCRYIGRYRYYNRYIGRYFGRYEYRSVTIFLECIYWPKYISVVSLSWALFQDMCTGVSSIPSVRNLVNWQVNRAFLPSISKLTDTDADTEYAAECSVGLPEHLSNRVLRDIHDCPGRW